MTNSYRFELGDDLYRGVWTCNNVTTKIYQKYIFWRTLTLEKGKFFLLLLKSITYLKHCIKMFVTFDSDFWAGQAVEDGNLLPVCSLRVHGDLLGNLECSSI